MYFRHFSKYIIIKSQILQKLYLHYSNRPTEAVIGTTSGPGPHCPRCLRTVYDAERAIGLNDVRTQIKQFGYSYILERGGGSCNLQKRLQGYGTPTKNSFFFFFFFKLWVVRTQIKQVGYSYILEKGGGVQGSNNKDCKGMDSPPTHPIFFSFFKLWLICFAQLCLPNFFWQSIPRCLYIHTCQTHDMSETYRNIIIECMFASRLMVDMRIPSCSFYPSCRHFITIPGLFVYRLGTSRVVAARNVKNL